MIGAACAIRASAQGWGVGAAAGATSDVTHHFSLEDWKEHDISGWIQYETWPDVHVRLTGGSMKTLQASSGQPVSPDQSTPPVTAPRMTERVDYVNIGATYEFVLQDFTSGIFAGLGAYRIRPDAAPPGFEFAEDPHKTVLGWHFGVDGGVRVAKHFSILGRLTLHGWESNGTRSVLVASAGVGYRF